MEVNEVTRDSTAAISVLTQGIKLHPLPCDRKVRLLWEERWRSYERGRKICSVMLAVRQYGACIKISLPFLERSLVFCGLIRRKLDEQNGLRKIMKEKEMCLTIFYQVGMSADLFFLLSLSVCRCMRRCTNTGKRRCFYCLRYRYKIYFDTWVCLWDACIH